MAHRESSFGKALFVAGAVMMIAGVLGISITAQTDWVSAVIGFLGAVISAAGLYLVSRRKGTGPAQTAS